MNILNKVKVVVGGQWGDEGKGKVTHFMAKNASAVARFAGGCNAGHTIIFGGNTYKLHHLPSGIFMEDCFNVLGNGMVIDPLILLDEINSITKNGYSVKNLKISDRAHIIMPYHRYIDGMNENSAKGTKLGTTGRGIGPVYMDKAARTGIRVVDLLNSPVLKEKIAFHFKDKEHLLSGSDLTPENVYEKIAPAAEKLIPFITDTSTLLYDLMLDGKNILLEGAQGALLDLDFGTYPFVTSSCATSGGTSSGTGLPPWCLGTVVGIVKAYTTRVGTGPFPTELKDEIGERLLKVGMEYGTTTGRARRCGWLDLALLKFASRINGFTSIALTKLDILTGINKIQVAVDYMYNGKILEGYPADIEMLNNCTPVYQEFEGWTEDISKNKTKEELPANAKNYIKFIEDYLKIPVSLISVGGDHDETIISDEKEILFKAPAFV